MTIDQPPPPGEIARRRLNRGLFFLAAAATASGLSFFLDPASLEQTADDPLMPTHNPTAK